MVSGTDQSDGLRVLDDYEAYLFKTDCTIRVFWWIMHNRTPPKYITANHFISDHLHYNRVASNNTTQVGATPS